jgi:hypothetical protein
MFVDGQKAWGRNVVRVLGGGRADLKCCAFLARRGNTGRQPSSIIHQLRTRVRYALEARLAIRDLEFESTQVRMSFKPRKCNPGTMQEPSTSSAASCIFCLLGCGPNSSFGDEAEMGEHHRKSDQICG